MGQIFHSVNDSEILGLKTGHAFVSAQNIHTILAETIQGDFDICRLKIPEADKQEVFAILQQSGYDWHHAYDIVKYYPITGNFPPNMPLTEGLSFELYTGESADTLIELIKQSYADDPIGYYLSAQLATYISKEQEALCLATYLSKEFVGNNYRLWIIKLFGEAVGFTANRIDWVKKEYEGLHAGVLPNYRNAGLFASLIRFNINYSQTIGIIANPTGTRSHNRASQRVFEGEGITTTGTEAIVHLMPLFSINKRQLIDRTGNSQTHILGRESEVVK